MKKRFITVLLLWPWLAGAHTGHGLPGSSHWHATDTWGLLVVLVLGAAAGWLSKRK